MILIPKGFLFSAAAAGFKYQARDDLALILSDRPAVLAGVFTQNKFQAAPVLVARETVTQNGLGRGFLINAGQANACTGEQGLANCRQTLAFTAQALGILPQELVPASTGVIGDHLKMDLFESAVQKLKKNLGRSSAMDAAKAIMTTDTFPKLVWKNLDTPQGGIRILGMAKGAGMICPNMATLLGFLVCDASVEQQWWQKTVAHAVDMSFNAITIDGDTSTNDMVAAMANGAGDVSVDDQSMKSALTEGVYEVCRDLAYMIVQDAEGGTKVATITVTGGRTREDAERVARTVAHSPLVKTALFGQDPNWGRIVAALGRSGADFRPELVTISLASIPIFTGGQPVAMDRDAVFAPYLHRKDIDIQIDLKAGSQTYQLLTSDLSFDYVRINAEYRT